MYLPTCIAWVRYLPPVAYKNGVVARQAQMQSIGPWLWAPLPLLARFPSSRLGAGSANLGMHPRLTRHATADAEPCT